ncbi:MAG: hypothetical protein ACTSWL_00185, partial [Promethearchaeota archaeon]
ASLLSIGVIIGVIMRAAGSNFYAIWAVVAVINTIVAVGVLKLVKNDLTPVEEKEIPKKKESKNSTDSDKKVSA